MSENQETGKQSKNYVFPYDWKTVMKGFWNKYPDKKLDFVKWNKVIGFDINEDGSLKFRRVIYIKKFYLIWAYGQEELHFNFRQKILDAKTRVLKKSSWVPYSADEYIQYREFFNKDNLIEKKNTMYKKMLDYNTS